MLEKLTIKNFQSHRKTILEFDPGINVIVGKSQSGKTAILRSLYWLFFNRPPGLKMRTQGNNRPIRVNAVIDGKTVTLAKGKIAKYLLDDEEWKGFNRKVPEKIESFLNVNEINIQKQLDSHFLITSSPQEIARVINQITGLEKIDSWVKKLTTQINTFSVKKEVLSEEREKVKKKLAIFEDIEVLDSIYEEAKKLNKKIVKNKTIFVKLTNLRINRNKTISKLNHINKALKAEEDIAAAIELQTRISAHNKRLELLMQYKETQIEIKNLNITIAYISDAIDSAKRIKVELDKNEEKIRIMENIRTSIKKITGIEATHGIMMKEYTKLLEESGECPTCFSPVSKAMLKRIVKKL